jgi:hypothetical protein
VLEVLDNLREVVQKQETILTLELDKLDEDGSVKYIKKNNIIFVK